MQHYKTVTGYGQTELLAEYFHDPADHALSLSEFLEAEYEEGWALVSMDWSGGRWVFRAIGRNS